MRAVKMLITLAAAAALCTAVISLPKRLAFDGGDRYTFFVGNTSADCREVTVTQGAALKRLMLTNVCGEAAHFGSLDIEQFLDGVEGQIIFTENLSDSCNYYCTANLPYSVSLYGREINLHICVRSDGVTVASPVIFGGY